MIALVVSILFIVLGSGALLWIDQKEVPLVISPRSTQYSFGDFAKGDQILFPSGGGNAQLGIMPRSSWDAIQIVKYLGVSVPNLAYPAASNFTVPIYVLTGEPYEIQSDGKYVLWGSNFGNGTQTFTILEKTRPYVNLGFDFLLFGLSGLIFTVLVNLPEPAFVRTSSAS